MQIYAPDGPIGTPSSPRTPGPTVLAGLRIGVLDNAKPNARLVMVRAAEQLAARTGARVTLVTDKGPGHNAATACSEEIIESTSRPMSI